MLCKGCNAVPGTVKRCMNAEYVAFCFDCDIIRTYLFPHAVWQTRVVEEIRL